MSNAQAPGEEGGANRVDSAALREGARAPRADTLAAVDCELASRKVVTPSGIGMTISQLQEGSIYRRHADGVGAPALGKGAVCEIADLLKRINHQHARTGEAIAAGCEHPDRHCTRAGKSANRVRPAGLHESGRAVDAKLLNAVVNQVPPRELITSAGAGVFPKMEKSGMRLAAHRVGPAALGKGPRAKDADDLVFGYCQAARARQIVAAAGAGAVGNVKAARGRC